MGGKRGQVWRAWTPEEIGRMRALAGVKPIAEIARELGRTENSVREQARTRGIPLRVWRR
jgi:hypothetical protein